MLFTLCMWGRFTKSLRQVIFNVKGWYIGNLCHYMISISVIVLQRLVESRSETKIWTLFVLPSVSCPTPHVHSFGTSGLFFCIWLEPIAYLCQPKLPPWDLGASKNFNTTVPMEESWCCRSSCCTHRCMRNVYCSKWKGTVVHSLCETSCPPRTVH